jgi:two-component system, sensor histidine kinase PdtaS
MNLAKAISIVFIFLFLPKLSFQSEADTLLKLIASTNDQIDKIELYIRLGDTYEYSDPDQAIYYYEQAYELCNVIRSTSKNKNLLPQVEILRAKSLRYMGIVHSDQGNYQAALDYYFEAKKSLEDVKGLYTSLARRDVDLKTAKLLNNIGVVFSNQSMFEIAKEYYLEALSVYQDLEDKKSIAVVYNSIGIVEARQANISEALIFFRNALDIYIEINDKEGIAQTQNNIGNVYMHHGSYRDALELYTQAYMGFVEMQYVHRVASTLNNIGRANQHLGNYDRAVENFQESIRLREEIKDLRGLNESFNNLGDLYLELEELEMARNYFQNALEVSAELGDNFNLAVAKINLGKVWAQTGNYSRAIESTLNGLNISEEFNLKFQISSALYNLSDYYAGQGDFRNAFLYSRKHYEISQEILDEQKSRQINELEVGYQAREKQTRIELLEQEKRINNLKLRQSATLIFILALLFLFLLISGIFTMLFVKQKNKILLMNKERETSSLLKKSDNDLRAIVKSHVYAIVLFDSQLNVIAINSLAQQWFSRFLNYNLNAGDSLYSVSHPLANEIINDLIFYSARGESKEKELETVSKEDNNTYYNKVFSNPVYDESGEIIQSISLMIEDITRIRDKEVKIISDLKEKETLIKEIHHRVKNNMQVIISLIRLQSNETADINIKESYNELEQRVAAMSYVHEELYKSDNLADIDFEEYLKKISTNLISIYNRSVQVNNHLQVHDSFVNIDIAVPCGLVINELLSNSLKHAFINEENSSASPEKKVDVYFSEINSNYKLVVHDNGKGLDSDFDIENKGSMGLHLVRVIVEEQLRGTWQIENQNGLKVTITFPKNN